MEGHAKKGGERHCELAEKSISAFKPAETLCMDDHQFSPNGVNCTGQLGTSFHQSNNTLHAKVFCWRRKSRLPTLDYFRTLLLP